MTTRDLYDIAVCLAEELAEMKYSPAKVQEIGMELDGRLDGASPDRSVEGTLANVYWTTYHKRRREVYDMSTMQFRDAPTQSCSESCRQQDRDMPTMWASGGATAICKSP